MRSARVPLLYPCRYAREKLSIRESDRCSPLAFCPKRIPVGRAHHHRKRMHSIRRFRTKLTFRRNILPSCNGTITPGHTYATGRTGGGVLVGGSRMTIDPRILTTLGRSTSIVTDQADIACTKREASTVRCSGANRVKGELHPTKSRS